MRYICFPFTKIRNTRDSRVRLETLIHFALTTTGMYYYIYYSVLGTARQHKRTTCATNSTKWFKLLAVTWLRCHRYADSILEDRCVFGREAVVLILAMYGSIHIHTGHMLSSAVRHRPLPGCAFSYERCATVSPQCVTSSTWTVPSRAPPRS